MHVGMHCKQLESSMCRQPPWVGSQAMLCLGLRFLAHLGLPPISAVPQFPECFEDQALMTALPVPRFPESPSSPSSPSFPSSQRPALAIASACKLLYPTSRKCRSAPNCFCFGSSFGCMATLAHAPGPMQPNGHFNPISSLTLFVNLDSSPQPFSANTSSTQAISAQGP